MGITGGFSTGQAHTIASQLTSTTTTSGFLSSLKGLDKFLGPAGGVMGAAQFGMALLSGKMNITQLLTTGISTAVSFIPVVGPFLSPLVAPIISWGAKKYQKYKSKKDAKKLMKKMAPLQNQITQLKTQLANTTDPAQRTQLANQIKSLSGQMQGIFNAYAAKNPQKAQMMFDMKDNNPACGALFRALSDTEIDSNAADMIIANPNDLGTVNNYVEQAKRFRDGNLLFNAWSKDDAGKTQPVTQGSIAKWGNEVAKNSQDFFDVSSYKAIKDIDGKVTNQAAIDAETSKSYEAVKFIASKGSTDPDVVRLSQKSRADFTTEDAKNFAEKIESLIEKGKSKDTNVEALTEAEKAFLQGTEDAMAHAAQLHPQETFEAIRKAYGQTTNFTGSSLNTFPVTWAEVSAQEGASLGEKIAKAVFVKMGKSATDTTSALDKNDVLKKAFGVTNIDDPLLKSLADTGTTTDMAKWASDYLRQSTEDLNAYKKFAEDYLKQLERQSSILVGTGGISQAPIVAGQPSELWSIISPMGQNVGNNDIHTALQGMTPAQVLARFPFMADKIEAELKARGKDVGVAPAGETLEQKIVRIAAAVERLSTLPAGEVETPQWKIVTAMMWTFDKTGSTSSSSSNYDGFISRAELGNDAIQSGATPIELATHLFSAVTAGIDRASSFSHEQLRVWVSEKLGAEPSFERQQQFLNEYGLDKFFNIADFVAGDASFAQKFATAFFAKVDGIDPQTGAIPIIDQNPPNGAITLTELTTLFTPFNPLIF